MSRGIGESDERCDYRSKWGACERCIRIPHADADHWFTTPQEVCRVPIGPMHIGQKWRCLCGQRWIGRHGDGMLTPPRLYWKEVHGWFHLGGYGGRRD